MALFNLYTGAEETLEGVDTVVLAAGSKADDALYRAFKGRVANVHRIGDCVAPRKLDHAIYEGYIAGRELWSPEERYIYEGELERWEEATVGARMYDPEAARDLTRVVVAVVVDHDDLVAPREVLRLQGGERPSQVGALVVGGNDHREPRLLLALPHVVRPQVGPFGVRPPPSSPLDARQVDLRPT